MLSEVVANLDLDLANIFIGYTILMALSWTLGYLSFSILWVWLLAVFILLRLRLWRDREKRILALQYVAVKEKDAILRYLKDVPAWVQFPDSERVEWMNKVGVEGRWWGRGW